jgi:glycosyltransferase involved in cell wall biosynthesis
LKLLFTQDALVNAGAERSHLEILSRFSEEMEASLVYFYPKHELKEAYERAGIRLFFLDIPEGYHFPLAVYRLVLLIRKEKPDLLLSCLWRADMITRIASWITGVPLIGTLVNDSYAPLAWKDKKGLKYKLVYWLDRFSAGVPKHWISNSQALVESHQITLGLKEEKISVIYRGREVPKVPKREPKPIRNFISYGRLLERKGFQEAILAFSRVYEAYPDTRLTIYGEGPYRPNLEKLIRDLQLEDFIQLPGKISNPDFLLQNADCFLFPSWYEGFSGALVEAMMAGIPIIASDIPMNLEAVEDQETALIFPKTSSVELANQMIWAINHPSEMIAMGNRAREIAQNRFDIDQIAGQYQNTLQTIISTIESK